MKYRFLTLSLSVLTLVGSVMTGAPYYVSTEAVFNVPQAIPSGDETGGKTTGTEIAIWNGLGGFGTGSGLIQGGVGISTTPYAAVYGSWREYCCGDKYSNGYPGAFTPIPNDTIYSVEWYCDSQGNLNLNGGYGCTFLEDERSGAILSWNNSLVPNRCNLLEELVGLSRLGIDLQPPTFTAYGLKSIIKNVANFPRCSGTGY